MAKMEIFDIEADAVVVVPNAKSLDPQLIGMSLLATARKHGGKLRADDALEEAKDPSHPMHSHLTWDDAVAGHQYRLQQCRAIIRLVRVEEGPDRELRRAFINITADDGRSYRTLSDVISSQSLKDRLLEAAERDLAAWQHRYAELKDVCAIVETARVALRGRRRTTPGAGASPPPA